MANIALEEHQNAMADRGQATVVTLESGSSRRPEEPARVSELASSPDRFINRELSWLELQPPGVGGIRQSRTTRCWSGSNSSRSPPPTSTNSSWCALPASAPQLRAGIAEKSPEGLTPAEQLARIGEARRRCSSSDQQAQWRELRAALGRGRHRAGRRRAMSPRPRRPGSKTIFSPTSFRC